MNSNVSQELEHALNQPDLHLEWIKRFRNPENEQFFERAFDYVSEELAAPDNSVILDCGCGTCAHSIRLAKRGFRVAGIDISECALEMARQRVAENGLGDRIKLQKENLLNLTFKPEQFRYALCWGVLMHVADLKLALKELHRVLKPNGFLVLSEINLRSLHAFLKRHIKRFLGRHSFAGVRTPAGIEYWSEEAFGCLVTRHTDMRWLAKTLREMGFALQSRKASQFTELYTRVTNPRVRRLIHWFNRAYFDYCKLPGPSLGNIIVAKKVR